MSILVIGDSCIDTYVYGSCTRLCPEGPVPVLNYKYENVMKGMANNTYNNMRSIYKKEKIDFVSNDFRCISKMRFVDEKTNQLLLRVDEGDVAARITERQLKSIIAQKYKAVVISDYNKGFLTVEDIVVLCKNIPISFIDSKKKLDDIYEHCRFVKINEAEWLQNKELIAERPEKFIVTLGGAGVRYLDEIYPPPKVYQTFDVSGAGDVFMAAFASKIIEGFTTKISIDFAQLCCSKVIQKRGTCIYEENMD